MGKACPEKAPKGPAPGPAPLQAESEALGPRSFAGTLGEKSALLSTEFPMQGVAVKSKLAASRQENRAGR